jgi:hypothetical protein
MKMAAVGHDISREARTILTAGLKYAPESWANTVQLRPFSRN